MKAGLLQVCIPHLLCSPACNLLSKAPTLLHSCHPLSHRALPLLQHSPQSSATIYGTSKFLPPYPPTAPNRLVSALLSLALLLYNVFNSLPGPPTYCLLSVHSSEQLPKLLVRYLCHPLFPSALPLPPVITG